MLRLALALVQRQRHPAEPGADRQPAPSADALPQKRYREGGDHQRIAGKDHLISNKTDHGEAIDSSADLRDQQQPAKRLEDRPSCAPKVSDAPIISRMPARVARADGAAVKMAASRSASCHAV